MQLSEKQIRKALIEMAAEALKLGMGNGEVIIAIEQPGEDFRLWSRTIGRIYRDSRNGDSGRNYFATASAKLAFSRRTKVPSGQYIDLPPMLCEVAIAGCLPVPIATGWVYFVCSGLTDGKDDELVCKTGRAILIMH